MPSFTSCCAGSPPARPPAPAASASSTCGAAPAPARPTCCARWRRRPTPGYIAAASAPDAFLYDPACRTYLVDDCEQLSADAQIAAFDLFNEVREHGA